MKRWCAEHKVWVILSGPDKRGCEQCRKEGHCPWYGRGCPC